MTLLYPQLPLSCASEVAELRRSTPIEFCAEVAAASHPAALYTATGGRRATLYELRKLRESLVLHAWAEGYPNPASEAQRRQFDVNAAKALHEGMQVVPAEASRSGIWSFLCCVLAPDLVRWRFPGATGSSSPVERFLPGRRNTFQRLWWRAEVLQLRGVERTYRLLLELGEDEVVQIMERPTLAGYRRLSIAVAEQLLQSAEQTPQISRRLLVREAQKRVMRLSSFISFDGLSDEFLRKRIEEVFLGVQAALQDLNNPEVVG